MRLFIAVLVLIFSFQSWTKADDIRDFQIEGMSIGDSLLDYMSKKRIKKKIVNQGYHNDDFKAILLNIQDKEIKIYDYLYIDYKNDNKFIIHSLAGIIDFNKKSIKKCFKKKKEIVNKLKLIFPNSDLINDEIPHKADTSGKSIVYRASFSHSESFYWPIEVACFDWSKKIKYEDHLRVSIKSDDYNDWLFEE